MLTLYHHYIALVGQAYFSARGASFHTLLNKHLSAWWEKQCTEMEKTTRFKELLSVNKSTDVVDKILAGLKLSN